MEEPKKVETVGGEEERESRQWREGRLLRRGAGAGAALRSRGKDPPCPVTHTLMELESVNAAAAAAEMGAFRSVKEQSRA